MVGGSKITVPVASSAPLGLGYYGAASTPIAHAMGYDLSLVSKTAF